MGKVRIIGGGRAGLYGVEPVYHRKQYEQRKADIEERIDAYSEKQSEAEESLDGAKADYDTAAEAVDQLMAEWVAAYNGTAAPGAPAPSMEDLDKAVAEASRLALLVSEYRRQVERWKATIKNLEAELQEMEDADDAPALAAWCADFTETLPPGAEVASIEIPGEPQRLMIYPQAMGEGGHDAGRDGQLVPRAWQVPAQVFFNAAILPGWQRHVYRHVPMRVSEDATAYAVTGYGALYRITGDQAERTDTLSCLLHEPERSSAMDLPVRPSDEPIQGAIAEYMDRDADAFIAGDRVIYDRIKSAVIGFQEHPVDRRYAGLTDWFNPEKPWEQITWGESGARYYLYPDDKVYMHGRILAQIPGDVLGAAIMDTEQGRLLLVAGYDAPATIAVWSLPESSWFLGVLPDQIGSVNMPFAHGDGVHSACFSPDGARFRMLHISHDVVGVVHAVTEVSGQIGPDSSVSWSTLPASSGTSTGSIESTQDIWTISAYAKITTFQDSQTRYSVSATAKIAVDISPDGTDCEAVMQYTLSENDSVIVNYATAQHNSVLGGQTLYMARDREESKRASEYLVVKFSGNGQGDIVLWDLKEDDALKHPYYWETMVKDGEFAEEHLRINQRGPAWEEWLSRVDEALSDRNDEQIASHTMTLTTGELSLIDIRAGGELAHQQYSYHYKGKSGGITAELTFDINKSRQLRDVYGGTVWQFPADSTWVRHNSRWQERQSFEMRSRSVNFTDDEYENQGAQGAIPLGGIPLYATDVPPTRTTSSDVLPDARWAFRGARVYPFFTVTSDYKRVAAEDWSGVVHSNISGLDEMPAGFFTPPSSQSSGED
ncbi:hypothetical protein LWH94_15845 [Marinobacter sp. G11]|uniref:hypothetical protein n=1 Tax=Marinobacter sp. G11 TaxID=2903522 RepID=UPI001E311BB0|nr:hypothetical protein [Marinobacter sp. G11]MCE0760664.1 hypothetical protein [Marinobacter sp. G11]